MLSSVAEPEMCGKHIGLIFPSTALISASTEQNPVRAEGTETHPTSGSAMLLNVLDGTTAEGNCTGSLSRSGASPPYQSPIEDEDDDKYENDCDRGATPLCALRSER
jgi:hypothetical protein